MPVTEDLLALLDRSVEIREGRVEVTQSGHLRETIHRLAEVSALGSPRRRGMACYLIRAIALAQGILPSSIHSLYMGRGRGEVPPTFTVPALNLRQLPFEAARAVFQAAQALDAGPVLFEISRLEIAFTGQRPAEYAASILAAAIAEGYRGPVFLQGDHFQISAARYAVQPADELQSVERLTGEAIRAGFYNIDIDASTLVDLDRPTLLEQQARNSELTARFTSIIRSLEPPGVPIAVGGEIGEVGGRNSTEAELRAFMDGYQQALARYAPGAAGLCKISIQTGTSHGGVILPDGSIAEANVDFETLRRLSQAARRLYGLGGAVQHGASTLPQAALGKFAEYEACEIHLATHFTNLFYDHLPAGLKTEMMAYLDRAMAAERQPGMTGEQFYQKYRKFALGPFKKEIWNLPGEVKTAMRLAWREAFHELFRLLELPGARRFVEQAVRPVAIPPRLEDYTIQADSLETAPDLAE